MTAMNETSRRLYVFGEYHYDPRKQRLWRADVPVFLASRSHDVLHYLLQRAGEVVTREELLKAVWGDAFVEDANLTVAISNLRKVLRQGDKDDSFIRTIPRIGYCFIADVQIEEVKPPIRELPPAPSLPRTLAAPQPQLPDVLPDVLSDIPAAAAPLLKRRHFIRRIALTMLSLAGGMAAWSVWRGRGKAEPFQQFSLERLPLAGQPTVVAISNDGKRMAYTLLKNDKTSLWMFDLASNTSAEIQPPTESGFRGLTFSPDDSWLYFVRKNDELGRWDLYRLPTIGGETQWVRENVQSPIAFSPRGDQYAYLVENRATGESSLQIAGLDGSAPRVLTTRKTPDFFPMDGPAWSPDGRMIVTPAGSLRPSVYFNVIGIDVSSDREKPLSPQQWPNVRRARWLPDGSGLIVAIAVEDQPHQLFFLSLPDGNVRRITKDLSAYPLGAIVAPRGNTLAAVQERRTYSLWQASLHEMSETRRITTGTETKDGLDGVVWLPDHRFVYVSNAGGHSELWETRPDGLAKKFSGESFTGRYPASSPDGRWLVVARSTAAGTQIWRADTKSKSWQAVTHGALDLDPQISPDNKWVVYSSEKSGRRTIWKAPLEGGEAKQLTNAASESPVISPDGEWIACLYWDNNPTGPGKVALLPFAGGEPVQYLDIPFPEFARRRFFRWGRDGKSLICIGVTNGVANLFLYPLDKSPVRQLTDFKTDYISSFNLSPDGKHLIIARFSLTTNIVLLKDAGKREPGAEFSGLG